MRSTHLVLALLLQEIHASGSCFFSREPIDREGLIAPATALVGTWQCDTLKNPQDLLDPAKATPFEVTIDNSGHYLISAPTATVDSFRQMTAHASQVGSRAFLNIRVTNRRGDHAYFFAEYRLVTSRRVTLQLVVDELLPAESKEPTRRLFERLMNDEGFYDSAILTCEKR